MKTDGRGRFFLECPNCKQLHQVRKQTSHLSKQSIRIHCRQCGCSWKPTEEEQNKIRESYGITPEEAKTKTKTKTKSQEQGQDPETDKRSLGERIFGR